MKKGFSIISEEIDMTKGFFYVVLLQITFFSADTYENALALSKDAQYTSNLSSDETQETGHRKRKQKRFSDSDADGNNVQNHVY